MGDSWKDMPLGPSEQDHERWAKESAARRDRQMDEVLKKANAASPMTTEIKQVDRDSANSLINAAFWAAPMRDRVTVAAEHFATRRETYEARIAELERERDAADLSRTAYARALEKMRIALVNVHDGMEDEGDRIYLGSTNHADDLKAAWHEADALHWEELLAHTQPKTDVVKANLHLQSELATAEARLAEAVEIIRTVYSEGISNHNTRCKSWWSLITNFIRKT